MSFLRNEIYAVQKHSLRHIFDQTRKNGFVGVDDRYGPLKCHQHTLLPDNFDINRFKTCFYDDKFLLVSQLVPL